MIEATNGDGVTVKNIDQQTAQTVAAGLGWLMAEMLVAMLQHVFDPPPDSLAVPWGFVALLGAGAVAGAVLASVLAAISLRRLPLGETLREE